MKIRVERGALADGVAWVARSLSSRPAVPVLGGMLLDAEDDTLTLCGFDYEVSTSIAVAATIGAGGRVLVSGRLLADITKALPARPVEIWVDGARVMISCGSAKFSLPTMPVEDYPNLPTMPADVGTVLGETFAEAVAQVAIAAGRDDTLPMLTGIQVEVSDSKLTLVATDRFRLAMRDCEWHRSGQVSDTTLLIPARALAEAAKSLGGAGTAVRLALSPDDGLIGLSGGDKQTTARLLDAQFPKIRQLLPKETLSSAIVKVGTLTEAIKRVSLVAQRGAQVRLDFTEDSVRLTAGGEDAGNAEEDLPVEFTGEPLSIAFNQNYLLDGLGAQHTEQAQLCFTTAARAALIKPVDPEGQVVPGYLYLLMPVRLPG
jgi:DNA polymerase-3 subunit beta